MKKDDLPKVGSCCWAVLEHLYYIPRKAAPLNHRKDTG